MPRQQSIYRQLALAESLAKGIPESEIVAKFAREWSLTRDSVRKAIKTLLATWARQEPRTYRSVSPWEKTQKTIERMDQLRGDLAKLISRREIVQRYAACWDVSTVYVEALITRVLSEDQHELIDESQVERSRYLAQINAYLRKYSELKDHPSSSEAYKRKALLEGNSQS